MAISRQVPAGTFLQGLPDPIGNFPQDQWDPMATSLQDLLIPDIFPQAQWNLMATSLQDRHQCLAPLSQGRLKKMF